MSRNIKGIADRIGAAVPVGLPADSETAGEGTRFGGRLPDGCRVVALGVNGTMRYYLDSTRQLVALEAQKHTRLGIQGLFGDAHGQLYDFYPRVGRDGEVTGWRPEAAAEALIAECARMGVWDPFERERGPGAWRGDEGELVLHCGNVVFVFPVGPKPFARRQECAPGLIGRYVYPAAPATPRPTPETAKGGDVGSAGELLTLLRSWSWSRGEVDAVLLLGWIGAAMIGGALEWRPMAWITGGRGTGKSTLHELLRHVLGALIQVSDPSAAGIWQKLRHSTMPVAVDELEAEDDNRKSTAIVKLARQAASGGVVLRGGADHQASEFNARSAFLFSSILMPPLPSQDRSRLAILELGELPQGAPQPAIDPKRWNAIGSLLRRRLVDGWSRFGQALEFYRASLIAAGHNARGADQFGTLLACADVLLYDHAPDSDTAEAWISKLAAAGLAENEDDARDEDGCLQHLLTSPIDFYRNGGRYPIGHWVSIAAGETEGEAIEANRVLASVGLRVISEGTPMLPRWLAVANSHQGLAPLFVGTHWATRSGASSVWRQALGRLKGAERSGKAVRFGSCTSKATIIPLSLVLSGTDADYPASHRTSPLPYGRED